MLSYWTVQPNRWTFETPKIRDWVEHHLTGRTLNMCAGPTELTHSAEITRNDLNTDIDADIHVDARTLDQHFDPNTFDTLLYDPPFSENQAETTYDITSASTDQTPIHNTIDTLLKPGGTLIHFGFDSTIMPPTYRYKPNKIALWNNLGGQYDWLSCVTQKPRTPPTNPQPASTAPPIGTVTPTVTVRESVHPNATIGSTAANTAATTGGNNGSALTFEYYRFPEHTNLRSVVETYLDTITNNRTLDVCHTDRTLSTNATVHQNALTHTVDADYQYAPQRLSQEFADNIFDTIVIDPHPSAFQRHISYYGREKVEATVLKLEAHPLLKPEADIIQVAHTATCMRSQLNYTRTNITVFSSPTAPKDVIVTTDQKQASPSKDTFKRTPEDIDVPETVSTADARHVCVRCGEGYYHHPVWYVDCLKCGSRNGNYCVTDDGHVTRTPHQHRLDTLQNKHQNCVSDNDLYSEPPVPFDDNQANSDTSQTSLTGILKTRQR